MLRSLPVQVRLLLVLAAAGGAQRGARARQFSSPLLLLIEKTGTLRSLPVQVRLLLVLAAAGLVVSKPDLVTFLEQMKNPWDVRRLETPAVYTVRTETLLLACDNLHELITIPFRGGQGAPRKTEHF
ncbi:hypothetical protein JEQ12_005615 [Ovis aries]|uniref:Uncharacterized protein n=1 Tax=Ovis aries TaxID=9940 RepID=A0A836A4G5_SHEEP|nr:hypothetical protein JEQ12_005615 [Ovis aries]